MVGALRPPYSAAPGMASSWLIAAMVSSVMYRERCTAYSSFCSKRMAPTRRTMASSLGSWEEFPTNADGLGAAFDLAVESFERVGVVQLAPRRSADDDHLHVSYTTSWDTIHKDIEIDLVRQEDRPRAHQRMASDQSAEDWRLCSSRLFRGLPSATRSDLPATRTAVGLSPKWPLKDRLNS